MLGAPGPVSLRGPAASAGSKVTITAPSPHQAEPPSSWAGLVPAGATALRAVMSRCSAGCRMAQRLGWWAASAPWCGVERCQSAPLAAGRQGQRQQLVCDGDDSSHSDDRLAAATNTSGSRWTVTAATTAGESGDRLRATYTHHFDIIDGKSLSIYRRLLSR